MPSTLLQNAYNSVSTTNLLHQRNRDRWKFLLESYSGGDEYRRGSHLVRYQLETAGDYAQRLRNTPLDNHCRSVVSVYVSFLFREPPQRDLGSIAGDPDVEDFLRDADFEGRSLDAFMKEVSVWSSVFGHAWILMTKPQVPAETLADQRDLGIRPYVNVLTPLVVLDWAWQREPSGRYRLTEFRYIEDVNDTETTVKHWTESTIRTYLVNDRKREATLLEEADNQLGRIPAIIVYNHRSQVRGIGLSDISDIADQQRAIYNELSEVEQSIRLEGHPSLVATPDVQMGNGAGSLIIIPDGMDPGLKPYVLGVDPVPVDKIYSSIRSRVESIDRMANTGAVRATETREISGIAMQTEFQLLNAKLSEKADNLELAEEQMWRLWCVYQDQSWDGTITYPDNFNIQDQDREFQSLKTVTEVAQDPVIREIVDRRIMTLLGEDPDLIADAQEERRYDNGEIIDARLPDAYQPATNPEVPPGQNCENCRHYDSRLFQCSRWGDAPVRPMFWCRAWGSRDE